VAPIEVGLELRTKYKYSGLSLATLNEIDQAGKIVEADMAEAGNAGVAAREIAPSVALNLYTYSANFWPDEDY
jgi:hypothetical protein